MSTAQGIHDHPTFKLGLAPPINKAKLDLTNLLTTRTPSHPSTTDHIKSLPFGLYENDQVGDCGPTGCANLTRLVSAGLTGTEVQPSQDDVFRLYSQSTDPPFNPTTRVNDNGVVLQTMLEAFLAHGIGDGKGGVIRPIAFGSIDARNGSAIAAATSIFGGTLWGVELQTSQQNQTDASPPEWDYSPSGIWGGHCVMGGAYEHTVDDVITWSRRVKVTRRFRQHQLQEVWVVIFEWHMEHPAFQAGVNLAQLEADYKSLTGKILGS